MIHQALDAGINIIDTADIYSGGESEEIVGKALTGRRDDVILATKFFRPMGDDPNRRGNSRRWVIRAVEESLRRLRTDWIDLYQVHRHDPDTDIEETLGALDDLVRAGKVRYIGTSTFPAHRIVEAQWASERRRRERFVSEQAPYSMLTRGVEADVLPVCRERRIGVLVWSPLSGGWLSGAYRLDRDIPVSRRAARFPEIYDVALDANRRKLEAADALARIADQAGISPIQLALAFVLRHPAVTSVIIGPRTPEHLESQLGADRIVLADDVLDAIDAVVAPGATLNAADVGYENPALTAAARRR
jgi:aryl-alcohol dehydrogenase-like predicted oxidoreductase